MGQQPVGALGALPQQQQQQAAAQQKQQQAPAGSKAKAKKVSSTYNTFRVTFCTLLLHVCYE